MARTPLRRTSPGFRKHILRKATQMEPLEPRTLLSANAVATATIDPVTGVSPLEGTYDANGSLWVVDGNAMTLDNIVNGAVVGTPIPLIATNAVDNSINAVSPIGGNSIVAGPAGHLYMADGTGNGGIDDINLTNSSFTFYPIANDNTEMPLNLTVTDNGAVWFTAEGQVTASTTIGRWMPGASSANFFTFANSDSAPNSISANGNDAVWVGLGETVGDTFARGTNHIASMSFNATNATFTSNVLPADATGNLANNSLTSVASDGNGGVWYTLSNVASNVSPNPGDPVQAADTLVHLDSTGHTTTVSVGTAFTPLNIQNLTLDTSGNLWFNELDGSHVDVYNTNATTNALTQASYPANTSSPDQLLVNPTAPEATVITLGDGDTINPALIDVGLVSGNTTDLHGAPGLVFNSTLLATFSAPPLATGNYTATISWGDATTSSVVTATPMGDNTYAIVISGKSFATAGTYNGSISITTSSSAQQVGSLAFQSVIATTDTPLDVTGFVAVPLLARITAAAGLFTDDPGLALSTWTATINWGDNTSSTGIIVRDPTQNGRYVVLGLHQYKSKGTYTVRLTVTTTQVGASILDNTATSVVVVR